MLMALTDSAGPVSGSVSGLNFMNNSKHSHDVTDDGF